MTIVAIIFAAMMMNNPQQNGGYILLSASVMETEDRWRVVNDDVMGGVSSSRAVIRDKRILFSGTVSLENNGGFASLRSRIKDYDFAKFSGIEIRLKGDGKLYSISMKETSYFSGYFYTSSFETKENEWIVLQIPFDRFRLHYFGKDINSGRKAPLGKMKEIALLIGDKQEGNFEAEIDYMMLY